MIYSSIVFGCHHIESDSTAVLSSGDKYFHTEGRVVLPRRPLTRAASETHPAVEDATAVISGGENQGTLKSAGLISSKWLFLRKDEF